MNTERLNPITMHALRLLSACEDDIVAAREVAAIQYEIGEHRKDWHSIWSVLNGERGEA